MPHKPQDSSPVSCLERETSFKEESFTPRPGSTFLGKSSFAQAKADASSLESRPHNGLAHGLISKRPPILCIELKSKGSDYKTRL